MRASVSRDGRVIFVDGASPAEVARRVESAFATRIRPGLMVAPATPYAALDVIEMLSTEAGAVVDPQIAELAARAGSRRRVADPLPVPEHGDAAWRHQRVGFWFAEDAQATLVRFKMGEGKSKVAVDLARHWRARDVLVVCPRSMVPGWRDKLEDHGEPGAWEYLGLDGDSVARRARLAAEFLARRTARQRWLVVSYDGFWRGDLGTALLRHAWDLVVADEVHHVKAPGSKQSRFATQLGKLARRRLALSGTPLAHSPLDAYGVMRFLDPGVFGESFTRFRARYAVMGGFAGKQVLGYQNMDRFRARFNALTIDAPPGVLDLPPAHDVVVHVEMPEKTRVAYRQLRDEFVAEVDGGVLAPANALTRLIRLMQMTSGVARIDDDAGGHRDVALDSAKEDALRDLLLGTERQPVVVFCLFRSDLDAAERAARGAGLGYLELSGRRRDLERWQRASDGHEVLGVQVQSGSEGIDLTRACAAVYFSLGHSLFLHDQSRARLHRPGQNRPVTYFHLVERGTVDVTIRSAIARRRDVVDAILAREVEVE